MYVELLGAVYVLLLTLRLYPIQPRFRLDYLCDIETSDSIAFGPS